MIHRSAKTDRERTARHLAAACGTSLLAAGLAAPPAAAAPAERAPARAARADDTRGGNGRHNNNTFSIKSPTRNSGYQHTNSGNAGGANSVQNALCRGSSVCRVTQNVTIVRPAASAPPQPDPFVYLAEYGLALMVPQAPEPAAVAQATPVTAVARYAHIQDRRRETSLRREPVLRHRASPPGDVRRPG